MGHSCNDYTTGTGRGGSRWAHSLNHSRSQAQLKGKAFGVDGSVPGSPGRLPDFNFLSFSFDNKIDSLCPGCKDWGSWLKNGTGSQSTWVDTCKCFLTFKEKIFPPIRGIV